MTEVKRPLSLLLSSSPTTSQAPAASNKTASLPGKRSLDMNSPKTKIPAKCHSTSSSSSSSTSSSCGGFETPDSPSLILPYLYVGDQAQTQIDTISSLNISYILSLQSLPKFLDTSPIATSETLSQPLVNSLNGAVKPDAINSHESRLSNSSLKPKSNSVKSDYRTIDIVIPKSSSAHEQQHHSKPSAIIRQLYENEVEIETQVESSDVQKDEYTKDIQQPSRVKRVSASARTNKSENNTIAEELLPMANSSKDYLVKFKSCVNRLIKGKCINISDTFEQLLDKFFDETHNFIEEARRKRCNILIHCKAGISRSPTIAIAYLMKWKRLHLQEAYEIVKQCRPQISPNLNFMGQLMKYERQLLQKDTCALGACMLPSPTSYRVPSHMIIDDYPPHDDRADK